MKKSKTLLVVTQSLAMLMAAGGLSSCGAHVTSPIDLTVDTRGQTISIWTGFGASISSSLESLLSTFEDLTGIHVVHESKGGYDNLQKAINGSASSQTYANVAVGYPDHFAGYIDSDIIHRLDEFIEQDSLIPATRTGSVTDPNDESATFEELPQLDLDDFYSYYMTELQTLEYKEDGTGYLLGLPFNKSTEVMVYNKSFFDLDSVKTAGIALPTTWDEVGTQTTKILDYVKGLRVTNASSQSVSIFGNGILASDDHLYFKEIPEALVNPTDEETEPVYAVLDLTKVSENDFHPFSYDSQANFFITGMRQYGGTYTEVDKDTRQGYIKFNEGTAAREFLTEMNGIYAKGGMGIPQTWGEASYCSTPFKAYKSVMNIGSSGGVSNSLAASFKAEVSCAPIPYKNANRKYVISQGTNLGIFDVGSTAQKAAAWKLVKYLSQFANGTFAAMTGYFPTCKSASLSRDYQNMLNNPKGNEEKLKAAAARINLDVFDNAEEKWMKFVDPGFVGSSTIRTDVDTITAEIFIDKKGVQDTINEHVENLRDYLPA